MSIVYEKLEKFKNSSTGLEHYENNHFKSSLLPFFPTKQPWLLRKAGMRFQF